jgi:hypothetical protein
MHTRHLNGARGVCCACDTTLGVTYAIIFKTHKWHRKALAVDIAIMSCVVLESNRNFQRENFSKPALDWNGNFKSFPYELEVNMSQTSSREK